MLFALLTACTTGGPLEGVWMIEATNPEVSCDTTFSHNLRDADEPDEPGEPGPWTNLDDYSQSLDIFFVRISHGRAGDVVLLVNDQIIPGEVGAEANSWTFSYVAETTDVTGEQHEDGYITKQTTTNEVNNTYTMMRVGNRYLEGQADFDSSTKDVWEESDIWSELDVGYYFGDMPSFYVGAPDNVADESNCTDSTCMITREFKCKNEAAFVGTFTGLEGESTFDVEDNSSNPGF